MTNTKRSLFIEGMQGSGKSTLLNRFSKALPGYTAYREGDLSPVELAFCSRMTAAELDGIMQQYPALKEKIMAKTVQEGNHFITAYTQVPTENHRFYAAMEAHEIYNGRVDFPTFRSIVYSRYRALNTTGNIFECAFFQNSIENMMLYFDMPAEEIFAFYAGAYRILKEKGFRLIYLDSADIRGNLLKVRHERVDAQGKELWFPMMMDYLTGSPYGQAHHCRDMEDLIAHFEQRRELELAIIRDVLETDAVVLPAKQYTDEDIRRIAADC